MDQKSIGEDDVKFDDIYFVDPFEIEILSRKVRPDKEILDMAISMHTHGQRRAVECRRAEDGGLRLVHGSIRTYAARLIHSGFAYMDPVTNANLRVKDRKFRLKAVICDNN